jgi:hypothetical protein
LRFVPVREQPYPSRQFGRHVHSRDIVAGQPSHQRRAQTGGALDRPAGLRVAPGETSQLPVAVPANLNTNTRQYPQR